MPYAVWIDVVDPDPRRSDEVTLAQRPELIMGLIEAGWDGPADPGHEVVDALQEAEAEGNVHELLDVRVLTYPDGAIIGVAVAGDDVEVALEVGLSLAHHLAGTPALFGWRLESLRTEKLSAPRAPDVWLPPVDEPRARFPVAAYLPRELRELCTKYLLVSAARDINDPTGHGRGTVDAADLVAGSVEHPWGSAFDEFLGGLLVAAARQEAATGTRSPLVGRGGGDPSLAQALIDIIRRDQEQPSTGYDDDQMRGFVLIDDFKTEHGLTFDRVDDTLDREADEERSREQRRTLLWAGLRALATLGKNTLDRDQSSWLWLAALDSDIVDSVISEFANRDEDYLEESSEHTESELYTATQAHLLMRLALLHPDLLREEAELGLNDIDVTAGPLHHIAVETLMSLGTDAIASVAEASGHPATKAAKMLLPLLKALDSDEGDPFADLHLALEKLLPRTRTGAGKRRHPAKTFLELITSAATAVGTDHAAKTARDLFIAPAASACVLIDDHTDRDVEDSLRLRILAAAAALSPLAAGKVAADLPQLRSQDPRDEPAARTEAMTWWNNSVQALNHHPDRSSIDLTKIECPEPGRTLLSGLVSGTPDLSAALAVMPVNDTVVATAQAISILSIALDNPELPYEIVRPKV